MYVYITLVRDPKERMISSFFHNGKDRKYSSPSWKDIVAESSLDKNINWYNIEFKQCFGIELKDIDFDRKKGYGIYYGDKIDLLVQRLDRLGIEDSLMYYFGPIFGSLTSFNERSTTSSGRDYRLTRNKLLQSNIYLDGYDEFRKLFWDA